MGKSRGGRAHCSKDASKREILTKVLKVAVSYVFRADVLTTLRLKFYLRIVEKTNRADLKKKEKKKKKKAVLIVQ